MQHPLRLPGGRRPVRRRHGIPDGHRVPSGAARAGFRIGRQRRHVHHGGEETRARGHWRLQVELVRRVVSQQRGRGLHSSLRQVRGENIKRSIAHGYSTLL